MDPFYDVCLNDTQATADMLALKNAQFIAFDSKFFDVIGPRPTLQQLPFTLPATLKEAPLYIPRTNSFYFGEMSLQEYYRVRLDGPGTSLEKVSILPHLPGLNAAVYDPVTDMIYATVNPTLHQAAGIYAIHPTTFQSTPIVNNFLGWPFNSPNDLTVDRNHGIYFTDPPLAALKGNFTNPVQLRSTVYFFNVTSRELRVIEEDLERPNGIAISPDGSSLYVADTGSLTRPPGQGMEQAKHHSIYAYDLSSRGHISNKRLIFRTDHWVPDGIKVSGTNLIFAASGVFVDVIESDSGTLLGKISVGSLVQNLVFAGVDYNELWMVGIGGVFKAKLSERGIPLVTSKKRRFWKSRSTEL